MNIESIKKHWIISLLVWTVAVGGVVASVMNYYNGQKLDRMMDVKKLELEALESELNSQIENLKARLLSIERGFGSGQRIDLRRLIINSKTSNRLSSKSMYHPDGNFYALRDEAKWPYKLYNSVDFGKFLFGDNHPIFKAVQFPEKVKIHVWQAPEIRVIENDVGMKRIVPYISVHYQEEADLVRQFRGELNKPLGVDLQSLILTQQINSANLIAHYSKGISYTIKSVSKTIDSNIQVIVVFRINGAIIHGERVRDIFIHQETIVIPRRGRIYEINIGIPFYEPLNREQPTLSGPSGMLV